MSLNSVVCRRSFEDLLIFVNLLRQHLLLLTLQLRKERHASSVLRSGHLLSSLSDKPLNLAFLLLFLPLHLFKPSPVLLLLKLALALRRLHELISRLVEHLERNWFLVENRRFSLFELCLELEHEVHWGHVLLVLETFVLGVSEDALEDGILVVPAIQIEIIEELSDRLPCGFFRLFLKSGLATLEVYIVFLLDYSWTAISGFFVPFLLVCNLLAHAEADGQVVERRFELLLVILSLCCRHVQAVPRHAMQRVTKSP